MKIFKLMAVLFMAAFIATSSFAADETQSVSLLTSGQKHFDHNEFSAAHKDWQKAADEGDTQAMDKLATIYASGTGVKIDYTKALEYWHKAADKNDGEAMYEIATAYDVGRGVTPDIKERDIWLQKSFDNCYRHAAVRVLLSTSALPSETDKALDCLKKNAQDGNYMAMMDIAGKNWEGQYVLKNPIEAASWGRIATETMQRKADAGDTEAMFYMGRAYFGGIGNSIPKDTKHGFALLEEAASRGNIDAMNWIATTYQVDNNYKDYKKVDFWDAKIMTYYTTRAQKGDVSAMVILADKYYRLPTGTGTEVTTVITKRKKDAGKAVMWAKKAAALGSREALSQLGYMYEDKGLTNDNPLHDCKKAHDYYDKAAALGDKKSMSRLATHAKAGQHLDCDF